MLKWFYTISIGLLGNVLLFVILKYTGLGSYITSSLKGMGVSSKTGAHIFIFFTIVIFFIANIAANRIVKTK